MIVNRILLKLAVFRDICQSICSLSYDAKYKVGAIIFTTDFTKIVSIGYNGNYKKGPNVRDSLESGKSGFVHAEVNALLKSGIIDDTHVLMCTWTPCWHCAKCIVNAGIKHAIFLEEYTKDEAYKKIFTDAGVAYCILDKDETKWNAEKIAQLLKQN